MAQNYALSGYIKNLPVKRRRQTDPDKPNKNVFDYKIKDPVDNDKVHQVCRKAMKNIFGVGESRVRKITKDRANSSLNLPSQDRRGRGESYIK